ncbi:MAG: U32 family peptidase, partial [Lentisphaeria bacterium]|nr:U32 family peptidase [Lentisphaeria bacterium]
MKNKICELLAPAGNPECAMAAIDAGADAVYCGLGRFNARCRAENFNPDTLGAMIDHMHSLGKKLYLTFNTLLFEEELEGAAEMLGELTRLAPDALIVHDPGVIFMAKKYFPSLKLHASTQMGIHNSAGVAAMAELGIERVILERQIPLNELEQIVKKSSIEIEVFIHGSLCCSLSGRCLLSAELCGGSGNRGCCKQPCRRSFETEQGNIFPLSMRDLNAVEILPFLKKIGVSSLKIEGRLRG